MMHLQKKVMRLESLTLLFDLATHVLAMDLKDNSKEANFLPVSKTVLTHEIDRKS
jgi:hypothetical protein